jgi:hypothetical protein
MYLINQQIGYTRRTLYHGIKYLYISFAKEPSPREVKWLRCCPPYQFHATKKKQKQTPWPVSVSELYRNI